MNAEISEECLKKMLKQATSAFPPPDSLKQTMHGRLMGIAQPQIAQARIAPRRSVRTKKAVVMAAAAAAVIAAITGVYLARRPGASVVWALEQAAQALENVKTVHVTGEVSSRFLAAEPLEVQQGAETTGFELWARRAKSGLESGELRFETADGKVIVVQQEVSYIYEPDQKIVYVRPGQTMTLSPWVGIAFDKLKEGSSDWKLVRGKDEETGQECLFVSCSYARPPMLRSWWFQFDVETKLPVRFKQWHNTEWKGTPAFDAEKLVYDQELSDDLFGFEIPEGAKVIEDSSATEGRTD